MEKTFSGGVFSESLENGRAGAEIELLRSGVCACTLDGDAFVIPFRECQIEVGGNSGKMVFCRNADRSITIFCEDRQFPQALSHAAGGLLDQQLADALKQARAHSRRSSLITASVVAAVALVIVTLYWSVRAGARAAAKSLPVSVDVQLGKVAFQAMDHGGAEVNDPLIVDGLQSIVDRLAPEAAIDGLQFDVHVVESPVANAYCLPGGTIVVLSGLIRTAETPEQLAAVLSHEMSHATLRHGLQGISQAMGLATAINLLIGDTEGLIATGEELFRTASINSYSRDQENAADREGLRMMHAAGIDPRGMPELFKLLKAEHGELPRSLAWMSTHPDHASRIADTNVMIDALPKRDYQPLEIDWQAVQSRMKNRKATSSGAR